MFKPLKYPRPLVINGPSGAGKTTMIRRIMELYPGEFSFTTSHTTRIPRRGEVYGSDYFFVMEEEMLDMIKKELLVEYDVVYGNIYGTSLKAIKDVRKRGVIPVLDLTLKGVCSIKRTGLNPLVIYINAPSIKELEKRLKKRNTELDKQLKKRLSAAKDVISFFNNNKDFFDYNIINDNLSKAVSELEEILFKEGFLKKK